MVFLTNTVMSKELSASVTFERRSQGQIFYTIG